MREVLLLLPLLLLLAQDLLLQINAVPDLLNLGDVVAVEDLCLLPIPFRLCLSWPQNVFCVSACLAQLARGGERVGKLMFTSKLQEKASNNS